MMTTNRVSVICSQEDRMAAKEICESSFIVENLEEDLIQDILNTLESIDVNPPLFPNIPITSSEVTGSVTEEASLDDDESQGLFTDLINERRMEPPEVESELKIYSQTYKKKSPFGRRRGRKVGYRSSTTAREGALCGVCGGRAGRHSYYGGLVCPSCRAFFRR